VAAPHGSVEARQLADLAGLAVLAAVLAPSRLVRGGPVVCVVRRFTGLPCPACGITRSWNAAARFELRRSLAYHPLGPLTFVLAALVATGDGRGADGGAARGRRAGAAALSAAWLAVWVTRLWRTAARR